jgi:hypothetical protein
MRERCRPMRLAGKAAIITGNGLVADGGLTLRT